MYLNNDKLKQGAFLVVLLILGLLLAWLLRGFLNGFLSAVVIYILLRKPFFFLTEKKKWNNTIAIILLMLASFIVLVIPVFLMTYLLAGKVSYGIAHYEEFLNVIKIWANTISERFGVNLLSDESIKTLTAQAGALLPGLLSATTSTLIDIFVLYFLLYFMMANARYLEKTVVSTLPFKKQNNDLLLMELKNMTISNAIGIPVLGVIQAIVAFIGYLILGVDQPLFWAVLTGLCSLLPVVGTLIVWVPLSIYLYVQGMHWQCFALLGYGGIVITNIDNVFRIIVQKKIGDVHPLVTALGVIVGLSLFGFIGLIFGPLLVSYFLLLLKIYKNEYLTPTIQLPNS
jgi:predicted PurR-regulated permease PerM